MLCRFAILLFLAASAFAQKPTFTVGWSVYAGWTPYHYMNKSGILRKWADKYGIATFNRAVELILDQSEAAARAFIRAMPDGAYATETYLDNDRSGGVCNILVMGSPIRLRS